jgi:hypothetical protein
LERERDSAPPSGDERVVVALSLTPLLLVMPAKEGIRGKRRS